MTSVHWRRAALLFYIGVIILTLAWEGWLLPARHTPALWLLIKTVPLLLPLAGMLRGHRLAYLWAMLLILLYFIEGVVLSVSRRADPFALDSVLPFALLETALSVLFFTAAANYLRLEKGVRQIRG